MNQKFEKFLELGADAAVIALGSVGVVAGFAADFTVAAMNPASKANNPYRFNPTGSRNSEMLESLDQAAKDKSSLGMYMVEVVTNRIGALREKLNEPAIENKGMKLK